MHGPSKRARCPRAPPAMLTRTTGSSLAHATDSFARSALVIVRHVHYDREGRPCLCEAIGLPIADDRNKITHVLSCTRDLSDREVVTWANGAVPPPDLGHDLTGRERHVLRLMAEGLGNLAIALQLRVTVHTVKYHVRNLLRKLGAANRAQAVSLALQHGLMHPPSRPDLRSRPGSQRD